MRISERAMSQIASERPSQGVLPGILLAGKSRGVDERIVVGFYERSRATSPDFPGRVVEIDGNEFVLIQPRVQRLLEKGKLDYVRDEYIIVSEDKAP